MHHGAELTVVLIAAVALVIGAALRALGKLVRVPFTVAMLLVGIATGLTIEAGALGDVGEVIGKGGDISSDLIVFVFLPALVFESAYAIELHQFRKNLGAVVLLAGPALVLSTIATAGLMVGVTAVTDWHWDWVTALVFGALISATDPVAVVAILRELGVTKRLGILIEGESLLNDGTSIVVFTLLIQVLTGETGQFDPVFAATRFLVVVGGGLAVGVVLSIIVSRWIGRTFNDPMTEITLTLVLAYSAMVVAEGMLHVSGVMAVVVSGLWMSSVGRTKVSPEVAHFLHRFWEMLGYIANTLIFFLVGLVIAHQVEHARLVDFVMIGVAYSGVMAIRFVLTYGFQPLTTRTSEGVSLADSAVMSWGGLRGAVSLALALVVFHNPTIEEGIRRQILLVTAGVVLLTILVNGSTIGRLLARLGYDRASLSKQLADLTSRAFVLEHVQSKIDEVSRSRDLRAVSWGDVKKNLDARKAALSEEIATSKAALANAPEIERKAGAWFRVLDIERQAYWEAFAEGTLAGPAVNMLTHEIDLQRDRLAKGDVTPPDRRAPVESVGGPWQRLPAGRTFEDLSRIYDLSRAESRAAARVLDDVPRLGEIDADVAAEIKATYSRYLREGIERIEDLRTNLPEMASAIENRLARRIELNFERDAFERLVHHGAMEHGDAEKFLEPVEEQMHALMHRRERVAIPETADLVAATPLFRNLDAGALARLAALTQEMVLGRGEVLFEAGAAGDAMYVIARGAVHIVIGDDVVEVLGGGDIIGEMSLLTGARRTATVRAGTSVTLGKVDRADFAGLMEQHPDLAEKVWGEFGRRVFDNFTRSHPTYGELDRDQRFAWLDRGQVVHQPAGSVHRRQPHHTHAFVVSGAIEVEGAKHSAPALVPLDGAESFSCDVETRLVMLPDHEIAGIVDARGTAS